MTEYLLLLKVKSAVLTRDTELMGKMDPYATIDISDLKFQTKEKTDAGKTPIVTNVEIKYTVWDKENVGKDDLVGSGSTILENLEKFRDPINLQLKLYYKEKEVGTIEIEIEYFGNEEALLTELHEEKDKYKALQENCKELQKEYTTLTEDKQKVEKVFLQQKERLEEIEKESSIKTKEIQEIEESLDKKTKELSKNKQDIIDLKSNGISGTISITNISVKMTEELNSKGYLIFTTLEKCLRTTNQNLEKDQVYWTEELKINLKNEFNLMIQFWEHGGRYLGCSSIDLVVLKKKKVMEIEVGIEKHRFIVGFLNFILKMI